MEPNNDDHGPADDGANRAVLRLWRERREDEVEEEEEEEEDNALAAAIEAIINGDNNSDNEDDNDDDDDDGVDDDGIQDPAEIQRICNKVISVIQQRAAFPSKIRDRTIVRYAQEFLDNVGNDVKNMITDTRTEENGYDGFDSERDTEDEVATAIRVLCPDDVLGQRHEPDNMYPIQYLTHSKAWPFVPLFAQLAIELNSFEEEERGGLLSENTSTGEILLRRLVHSSQNRLQIIDTAIDTTVDTTLDTTCLAILVRLRQLGLLKKEDIQEYELVQELCTCVPFPEHRFRFLTDWDPSSLLYSNLEFRYLPLHFADYLTGFQPVLEASIRYFPRFRGFLSVFQLDNDNSTPFQLACINSTRDIVMDVIEQTLAQQYSSANTTSIPFDFGTALITAAGDDRIHVDCVYFLSRRQPTTMVNMVRRDYYERPSAMPSSLLSSSSNNGNITHRHDTHNPPRNERTIADQGDAPLLGREPATDNNEDNDIMIRRRSTRKRKRD